MKTIFLHEPMGAKTVTPTPAVLALGFFDGVHKGHQAVITKAKALATARNLPLAVMTFDRHASAIFSEKTPRQLRYLTTLSEKLALFNQLGADISYVLTFDEALAFLTPQVFVDKYLVGLSAQVVVAGLDYTYGKTDLANMSTLPTHAAGRFEVVEVAKQLHAAKKISSTRIRKALDEGDIATANFLLGRAYENHGYVVHGFARGRTLGFPTLNIAGLSAQRLPAVGVYATRVKFCDSKRVYHAMTSIGYNETFGEHFSKTIEANVLDYAGDAYGQQVQIFWDEFLRPMKKFDSVASLVEQLHRDQTTARDFYAQNQLAALILAINGKSGN